MADVEKFEDPSSPDRPASVKSEILAEEYGVNEARLLRKVDWYIVPGVTILYLLSFLDRSNVANAKLDGLDKDVNMTGNQYLTGLTLFFVGYIALEVVWNVILKRVGPKLWLPTVTLVWGIIATLQGVVQNLAGFFVVRTFLGLAEGALFPGVVFYLSMWYKRNERQYRVSLFFSAAALAGSFGGILAYVRVDPRDLMACSQELTLYIGYWLHERCRWSEWLEVDIHYRQSLRTLPLICPR